MKKPAIAGFFVSGVARRQATFFCSAMPARGMSAKCPLLRRDLGAKVAKEKDTPCYGLRLPCATRQSKRLRARKGHPQHHELLKQLFCCETRPDKPQTSWLVAELIQCSPKSLGLSPLLGMAAGD